MRKVNSNRLRQIWQHLHLFDDILTLAVAGLDEPRLPVTSGSEDSNLFVAVPAHGVGSMVRFKYNFTLKVKILQICNFTFYHGSLPVYNVLREWHRAWHSRREL